MPRMIPLLALALLAASPALAVAAGDDGVDKPRRPRADQIFDKADTDKDGKLSKAELDAFEKARDEARKARREAKQAERFTRTDTDKDGFLSRDELKAEFDRMAEMRKSRRHKDAPPK